MSKRRRTSSVASRGQDEESGETDAAPEPARKKKKLDPAELCHQLYDTIRNHKKEDGTLLCDAFIRVPKRRQEPGYYEVVTNPIDLLKLQQKLKTDEYEDVDELTTDVQLMVNNAKAFYKRTSQEYRDACELWDLFVSTKNKLLEDQRPGEDAGQEHKGKIILKVGKLARRAAAAEARKQDSEAAEDTSESSTNPDEEANMYEDLFTAVMMATDQDNRPLHTVFQLLPSKKRYPEYYDVIDNPVDLKMIATKIQQNQYSNLGELEKDLLQMTRNACLFNEPGSQIYKDAKTLRKVISSKKIEVEHGKYQPGTGKSSERIRNKRMRGVQSLSAITAALRDEEEESDDGGPMDEDTALEDVDNPRWQLFETIKTTTNNQGHPLSEPFWKLPSKRYYPDYYKEIKNPVSLSQIRNKLKRGDYGTVSEVAGDMNIMFENAKKYNRPDSRLYKDAVKLQKIMQTKVQELLEFDQDSDSEEDSDDRGSRGRRRGRNAGGASASRGSRYRDEPSLKKRLHGLAKCLIDYVREDGRQPILMFMEKPSKKLYPDYFQVITDPIDMLTIEANIKSDKYTSEEEIIADFKLMFNNCRQYNEEGSMIYEDANKLEDVLAEKMREMGLGTIESVASSSSSAAAVPAVAAVTTTPSDSTSVRRTVERRVVKPRKNTTVLAQKLRTLYDTIRDYKDPKGRQLSLIFLKLPSKLEYPDYYEVIKRPIDLDRISQKLKSSQYEGLDDMVSDFVLMFDNACKYNEPDSQIYKDALMLQRVALQTKLQLREDEEAVPDVTAAVQELLTSLFISIYNHQDEEGRCFSDSMAELPEHDEIDGSKIRALSLDLIKRRLDRGLYRRLDTFQEDIFACLERARRLSRTDSQVFEDSIELQSFFIRQRDELCRGGDLLHSPALSYTLLHLAAAVEATRQQKLLQEQPEEEAETRSSEDSLRDAGGNASSGDSVSFNQQVYRIGDFVYAEPKERGMDTSIVNIERLWTNQEGQQMMYGNYFYRPNETYHVTTRRFLEKEVFKSDVHVAIPLDQVLGLCCVLSVKDYFRSRPEGFTDKDVYVCESRYSTKARAFKKIKSWPSNMSQHLTLIPREEVLEPKRVMSVFRERVEKHKEEIAELEEREKLVEKEKPNVEVLNGQTPDGCTYYEQFNTPCGVVRTGDCVYVRTDIGRQLIAQVDTVWTNKQGMCFFRGPWLVTPPEIPHAPTRLFYKQEVFLSTLEDTNTVDSIVGKCAVLEHGEYISCRPTEIPEHDVYVCESVYDEARRQVKKLPREGLKKYSHSNAVTEDEIYFFRRLINPPKIGSDSAQSQPVESMKTSLHYDMAPSPLLPRMKPDMLQMEDSLDGGPPSVGSGDTAAPVAVTGSACVIFQAPSPLLPKMEPDMLQLEDSLDGGPPSVGSGDTAPPVAVTTPVSSKKKSSGKKLVTGYILYSSDVRRSVAANHPESSFGEISRIVGNEWRNLPAQEKQCWEERAAKVNEESAAKFAQEEAAAAALASASPTSATSMLIKPVMNLNNCSQDQVVENLVFECCWDNCDWQFEDLTDCIDHCIQEPNGHVHQHFANIPPQDCEFQCQWRGCGRIKKGAPPFPNAQRLARHVKEVHIQKGNGRSIAPSDRSKNFMCSRSAPTQASVTNETTVGSTAGQNLSASHQAHSRQTPSPLAHVPGCGMTTSGVQSRPVEPLFISVPPRPQRLLHSEAYIKYIEGLQADSKHISHWDKHLKATPDNTAIPDPSRLPAHWLGNGVGNHGNIVNALWTLRDFMMRDALGINKVI
ncbi:Protein polybromo-1 [Cryptotermes secundus]|uniref:Protein polybromo-1 n=1 Tax=Cryptotermes secundus TaxID=105785 RepID=A0A2J7PP20_9NEOP|nr:protein polybromo-1 isoform X3 [Cryptotermes secundus]PNF18061.1 Protein polybromo-1 [Cryptotermes secundus]